MQQHDDSVTEIVLHNFIGNLTNLPGQKQS